MGRIRSVSNAALLLFGAAGLLRADQPLPRALEGIGVQEKIGTQINLDLEFTAENGYQVPLRSFFRQGRPVVLNLVYYECPMLCNLVLNGQTATMKEVSWTAGDQYEVVTISINPQETFALAQHKKENYLDLYGRKTTGWHFLADYQGNVARLAKEVGWQYRWEEASKQYVHSAAIMVLTPEGKISRYLYGIRYRAKDFQFALTEASELRIGNAIEKVLLFCYHYDPQANSYVVAAANVMRAGGVLIVLVLGSMLVHLFRRERAVRA